MADLRPRRVQGVWHRFVAEPYKDDAGSDRGALDYWRWLVDIPQVVSWVEASYYVPIRRAALPELRSFYAEDPRRQAAFGQVAQAQPRHPQFATWTIYLQEALEAI